MNATEEQVKTGKKSYAGQKFYQHDFSGQDLANMDFRNASLLDCNFKSADLSYANFEGANLYGSDLTDAKCYRTNFKDANLGHVLFHPKDCMGMTITFSCESFAGLRIRKLWWYCWIYMALLMEVPEKEDGDRLITAIGTERYQRLRELFGERIL